MTDCEAWSKKARLNFEQIDESDHLVLIASPEHLDGSKRVAGGKFVEAGYALGNMVPVHTVGGVENGMLFIANNHNTTENFLHAIDI